MFKRIEVHPATIRGYNPDRVKLFWRIPPVGQMTVPTTPSAVQQIGTEADAAVVAKTHVAE